MTAIAQQSWMTSQDMAKTHPLTPDMFLYHTRMHSVKPDMRMADIPEQTLTSQGTWLSNGTSPILVGLGATRGTVLSVELEHRNELMAHGTL